MQNIDSENRKADVTKIKAMRPRKSGYALLLPKEHDYSIILSIPNKPHFRLFCQFCSR